MKAASIMLMSLNRILIALSTINKYCPVFIISLLTTLPVNEAPAGPLPHVQRGEVVPVKLDEYSLVLSEDFSAGLDTYDGMQGIWSTGPRRDVLVTNGPQSAFLDGTEVTASGATVGLDPLSVKDGVLHISAGVIPEPKRDAVVELLEQTGQDRYAAKTESTPA